MSKGNLNFVKKEKPKKILEENHKIFDGANEDEFTKKSRKAIRNNLYHTGMEDPEEELRREGTRQEELEL